jgi:hypothetical protein
MSINLKGINWKRQGNTILKAALDFKVLGLLALNGLVLYGIGWDTVLRPNLASIQERDTALAEQRKQLDAKGSLQKQYGIWDQQLKSLNTALIPVSAGNSAKVLSVTTAAELQKLVEGKLRDTTVLPVLQPPHDQRQNVSLTAMGEGSLDILQAEGGGASPGTPPAQNGSPGAPNAGNNTGVATSLPVEWFNYDVKVTGTYPALMDVLNELSIWKTLVRINKIVITKTPVTEAQPDAKEYPDYPLKLDMVVSLSIFLYNADGTPAS